MKAAKQAHLLGVGEAVALLVLAGALAAAPLLRLHVRHWQHAPLLGRALLLPLLYLLAHLLLHPAPQDLREPSVDHGKYSLFLAIGSDMLLRM